MEIPVFSSNTGASIYGCPTEGREKDWVISKGEKEQNMFQRDGNPPVHSKVSAMSKFSMRNSNPVGGGGGLRWLNLKTLPTGDTSGEYLGAKSDFCPSSPLHHSFAKTKNSAH